MFFHLPSNQSLVESNGLAKGHEYLRKSDESGNLNGLFYLQLIQ